MKRLKKYKCKDDKDWLQNYQDGYVCPSCGSIYKEVSTKIKGYITDDEGNKFPISDTIIIRN